ncbi:probable serine/threonine-protein kinase clkA [Pogonomyrmex barbatus]|uniref:Probable serine/threonine-protein kinase clkA n=1 Tax=Pogonomyrmex barbatus TaxID=144034 RepID=A0A6I9WTQ6_9HYME|nr:probable serine/threonine-protein kinase clkA [Pogonomyrmex barbatus]
MIANLVTAMLFIVGNSASSTGTSHMTVSKMRIADLETSASGYAYNQQGGLPVAYMRYTNHGSGRYYHAPAPVHYVVGSPAPVAPAVSETTSSHEPVLLAYATAKHEIAPYVVRQPYPRDGFINYGVGQLAKYAQPLEPSKLTARAPYHAPNTFKPNETDKNIDKRSDNEEYEDDYDNDKDEDDDKKEKKAHVPENREEAVDFIASHPIHGLDNSRSDIDVSFELGEKYSAAQNSAHGEKGDKGYNKRVEFDVGERGQHDKNRQLEHYDTKTEHKKGHSDVAGNYGRHDENENGEKGSSYGQTSYHKKGQKTSGFHKVYHKDEYKKHTDFYDENHKKGYFDKYFASDRNHNTTEGNFKKGDRHEFGFNNENNGKKGFYDKGHTQNRDQGYNKERGENSFHNSYENYSSDENTHLTKKHDKVD